MYRQLAIAICAGCLTMGAFATTEGTFPSLSEFLCRISAPCEVLELQESPDVTVRILRCPKTGKFFRTSNWTEYDIDNVKPLTVAHTGFSEYGFSSSDIVAYTTVELRQGKVSFGYPYDFHCENQSFLTEAVMSNLVDGDYVSFSSGGTNYAAWATFSALDNELHWHEDATFKVLKQLPFPDFDTDFAYYRMQATNCTIAIVGGVKPDGPKNFLFCDYGVAEARRLFLMYPIKKDVKWERSLLSGKYEWVNDFKKTSILDTRKFYVVLKSGLKAFAMINKDHTELISPITHAALAVSKQSIDGFAPIMDGAYDEEKCYSKNEVEAIWNDYVNRLEPKNSEGSVGITLWDFWCKFKEFVVGGILSLLGIVLLLVLNSTKFGSRIIDWFSRINKKVHDKLRNKHPPA